MAHAPPTNDRSLEDVLIDDVLLTGVGRPGLPTDTEQRAIVRASFAAIEGALSALQSELLSTVGHRLSSEEKAFLQEIAYRLSDTGEVRTYPARLTLKQRVKFTAKLVARLRPESAIDFSSTGWQKLTASIDVRDRLTHPKTRADLAVSHGEMSDTLGGLLWFKWHLIDNLRGGVRAYQQQERENLARAFGRVISTEGGTMRSLLDEL